MARHKKSDVIVKGPNREVFPVSCVETGAVRGTDLADVDYTLLSPIALRRYAETMKEGAMKYGEYNWEKGFPIRNLLNHCLAHIHDFLSGDRSEDHLAHALWNIAAACHSQEAWPHLNPEGNKDGDLRPARRVDKS